MKRKYMLPLILTGIGIILLMNKEKVKEGANKIMAYFSDKDLKGQRNKLSPILLSKLDAFAEECAREGIEVIISPSDGALFDSDGHASSSMHYKGLAADLMIKKGSVIRAFEIAAKYFNGRGIYSDWKPYKGIHVDIREKVGTWGAYKVNGIQKYVGAQEVINRIRSAA